MRDYNQLTEEDRIEIYAMKQAGKPQKQIAAVLHVHPSTISRELKRMKRDPHWQGPTVSHERIYQHIWQDKANRGTLYTHLRIAGTKKKLTETNTELKQDRKMHRQDELDRIAIEGKFGQGKRRFTLDRIMTKLAQTSEVAIAMSFIVMNLEKILSNLLCFLFCLCRSCYAAMAVPTVNARNNCRKMHTAA